MPIIPQKQLAPLPRVVTQVPRPLPNTAPPPRVTDKLLLKPPLVHPTRIKPTASTLRSDKPYIQQRYGLRPTQAKKYSQNFRARAATHLIAQHVYSVNHPTSNPSQSCMHIFNDTGKKKSLDDLLTGTDKDVWTKSLSNELGRLAQGNVHGIKATDTIDFIHKKNIPSDRKVTYANFDINYRPLKSEKYRVRLVVGGDKLSYDDDAGSPAASLLETKVIINCVISNADKGAKFMSCDLNDFFLAIPMKKPEYMRIR